MDYAQLRNLDTSKLTTAAETAGSLSGSLASRGGEVASASQIPAGMWQGADSQSASTLLSPLSNPLYDVSDSAGQSQGVLEDLVSDLEAAKNKLDDAHDLAAGTGIVISGDGTVTTPVVQDEATAATNDRLAIQIRQIIDDALEMANNADDAAIGALASAGEIALGLPSPNSPLGNAAWVPFALGHTFSRFGNVASIRQAQLGRFAPRGPDGRFISWKNMGLWDRARYGARSGSMIAKPYQSATRANWATAGKWAGRAGSVLAVGTSTAEQLARDWNNPNMSNTEKGGRAAYRGAVQGGGAVAGGIAGGKLGAMGGAAIGTMIFPGVGTAVGGVVGGLVGGIAGGFAGSSIGGAIVDNTVDAVGNGVSKAVDAGKSVLSKINPF